MRAKWKIAEAFLAPGAYTDRDDLQIGKKFSGVDLWSRLEIVSRLPFPCTVSRLLRPFSPAQNRLFKLWNFCVFSYAATK